jgi:hypothetical protein
MAMGRGMCYCNPILKDHAQARNDLDPFVPDDLRRDTAMRIMVHYVFAALALGFYGGEV